MALDTKYRPQTYGDVLGQEAAVAVLQQFVAEGRGYHQSYVFCGQHGSGKTTLGRILARALLCSAPVGGAPCDQCESCQVFLSGGTHECFEELDAATKSGKADLARILEDISYSTVSGKRHIYLFDESHRLSKQALDALLKPMEDNVPGSEDKRLVCIFCTTEPEKMVSTIFSRCAPAFVIRSAPLEAIAARLAFICGQENISYEDDALMLAAEQSGSHIRDAIKMVEGVSMMGGVTRENAAKYLHLDANDTVLDLLEALESDLPQAVSHAMSLSQKMSPSGAYGRLAEAAMLIYQVHLGVSKVPMKWDTERISTLASEGATWLNVAQRFAAPPHRPTHQTLVLDTATVHHLYGLDAPTAPHVMISAKKVTLDSSSSEVGIIPHGDNLKSNLEQFHTPNGVYVDPRAIGQGPSDRFGETTEEPDTSNAISSTTFRELVRHHLQGLRGGRTR